LLRDEFGDEYHPVVEMARIATNMDNDVGLRMQANREVAKYVVPQLKAIEHTGTLSHAVGFTLNYLPPPADPAPPDPDD
jgi:hypothetical protein